MRIAEAAAMLAAALGCLQPAIDPVFLTLLSASSPVPLAAHGMIVGGTQAGAALGALAVWRLGQALPRPIFPIAAALACLSSLLSAAATEFTAILLLRLAYGAAMGMVFTHGMALCAARRPNAAYGGVFLLQLLLATLMSLALPAMADAQGPRAALALLALAPATACAALLVAGRGHFSAGRHADPHSAGPTGPVPPVGWALAAATFCFICATMLVWSFAGALAAQAGIAEGLIGEGVALGSLVGAATALAVMRERVLVPRPVTALLAGVMIASPVFLIGPGGAASFIISIILLNIGSTAMIIRCSGLATATSLDSRFRTFVACTHSLGMIAGPAAGSMLIAGFGYQGLLTGVIAVLTVGFAAIFYASKKGFGMAPPRHAKGAEISPANSLQSA